MRSLLTTVASIGILVGAYLYAFGLPGFVTHYLGSQTPAISTQAPDVEAPSPEASGTAASGPSGPRARPGGVRPGGRGSANANATTVVLTALEELPYTDIFNAVGSARALRSVDIVADIAGEVMEANLSANRLVEAGDMLVHFDDRTEALNLQIAQAELQQASDTLDRYEALEATGNSTISLVSLSDARIAQQLAQANVGLAQLALEDRTISSPISGRLGLSNVEIGDSLFAGDTIVTIDNAQSLVVEFELPERTIGMLSEQRSVLLSTPSFTGRVFEGEVTSFDSRVDDTTRSVTVWASVENPDGMLWPGMTFAVRMIEESEPLPAVPSTALTWSREGSSIWIEQNGQAVQVPVTILFRRNDMIWIDADLPEGVMVVSEGAQKLREGAQITAAGREPAARPRQAAPATPESGGEAT